MAEPRRVDLFCEDRAHEQLGTALLRRLSAEAGVDADLHVGCAAGGHGRVLAELKLYQRQLASRGGKPRDLLVVVIDSNCTPWAQARIAIERQIDEAQFPHVVVGCPEPHVERWYMADPDAFQAAVGTRPPADPGKCERDLYKRILSQAVRDAGQLALPDVYAFAPDIVASLHIDEVASMAHSFGPFVRDLRAAFTRLRQAR